jgi:cytochrome c2
MTHRRRPSHGTLPRRQRLADGRRVVWLARVGSALVCLDLLLAPLALHAARRDEAGDADDEHPYRPGVIARFAGADGKEHVRLEEQVSLTSGERPPDCRLAPGPFTARFDGLVLVQAPGAYRLRAFGAGHVRVTLAGKPLIEAHNPKPGWLDGETVELPFGFHALTARVARRDEPARLSLFWEGPGFALEPLAARWLFHNRGDTPADDFEQGRHLTRALRCAACHDVPGDRGPLAAAALDRLAGNIARAWLVERLTSRGAAEAGGTGDPTARRMPHFALAPADAAAVADYLLATSHHAPPAAAPQPAAAAANDAKKAKAKTAPPPEPPSADAGATLFRSVGCLACHRVGELGTDSLFGGGDLTTIAAKRPAGFFARWLAEPAALNHDHRMPVFALDEREAASLSLYLASLGQWRDSQASADPAHLARGAELVGALRCGACHALPKPEANPRQRLPLDVAVLERADGHCLAEPERSRPGYRLDAAARRRVVAYLTAVAAAPRALAAGAAELDGHDVLVERNCLACHPRGHGAGLSPQLPAVVEADPRLRDALPRLQPPSLLGVGDKLHAEALEQAIRRSSAPRRTWLRVRMPRFPLAEDETAALVEHLIDVDRIPDRPGVRQQPVDDHPSELDGAGARLVTADGFGCTSCHAIGTWTPQNVAPGAAGADLSQIGRRVRRAWFDRWVRNPARIVPQMEMPALVQPIRGVLGEDLDRQIAAIWHVLAREDFTPPAPSALRVVRRANLPGHDERAAVLTDGIEVGQARFTKPLVVGLANRHNVLYDLSTARLAAWWLGDVARQQTRGKSWFWEAGVPQLLPVVDETSQSASSELTLVHDGRRYAAVRRGQFITEFDALAHVDGGVELVHRVHYDLEGRSVTLRVTQRFAMLPSAGGDTSGFRRHVALEGLPAGARAELVALPGDALLARNPRIAVLGEPGRSVRVSLPARGAAQFAIDARGAVVSLGGDAAAVDPCACELEYRSGVRVDQFPPLPGVDRSVPRAELAVVPGFEAVRLPVTDQCMPTGLAWRPDGTLVVCSLEGRVWLGRDTDGDGLEDRLEPFSDELAAPYGAAAVGEAIDVVNKYGLVRLFDEDADGRADRTELVASGWGHTRDYHDWAIGLPRDAEGNYYVSLPCQQDDRSPAAAHLRGSIVKLVPREPTSDNPRRYAIEAICGGLRFGQGLARSSEGELFVTDNQGNYNPFNELNHVVPHARYGFINQLEQEAGMRPGLHRQAAIEIPHPWTRSVNGICFLAPPAGAADGAARDAAARFGPFAGHLVGCEYDTRRLVRMSLERVRGEFQGAVYPLSREPLGDQETFEGPVVCDVSPAGDLYVGNLRDSGWGAGSNTGSIVRLRWRGGLPPGIAEVRARPRGFEIRFTTPVDRALAADRANFALASYRRVSTPAYGGPDIERRAETIHSVAVSDDARSAAIGLAELRPGFVYEFHLRNLVRDGPFFPAEAYYTLRSVASDDAQAGK